MIEDDAGDLSEINYTLSNNNKNAKPLLKKSEMKNTIVKEGQPT